MQKKNILKIKQLTTIFFYKSTVNNVSILLGRGRRFTSWTSAYLMTSSRPSAMMNISRATSPLRQMRSPGVKMYARILSTRSCRNSGSHSWNIVTYCQCTLNSMHCHASGSAACCRTVSALLTLCMQIYTWRCVRVLV